VIGVAFDGLAYGSLLFLVSLGLSVQMGLMNFVNLAHGAFAMAGGFVAVVLMSRFGVPFLATLPIAFAATALAGAILERLLYRRLYGASHLDQVLFSIGLAFMSVAAATYFFGAAQQPLRQGKLTLAPNDGRQRSRQRRGFHLRHCAPEKAGAHRTCPQGSGLRRSAALREPA